MSRLRRLEFQGAIHLLRIRGRAGDGIFFDAAVLTGGQPAAAEWPAGLRYFGRLAWGIFGESGVRVHGYSLEPDSCLLVLQSLGPPMHAVMRRLCGEYSRHLHQQRGIPAGRSAFAGRYESRILAPNYLPHAIRRVHRGPVEARLVEHYSDYPFSSDGAYRGATAETLAQVETTCTRKWLARKRFTGVAGYRRFMELSDSRHVAALFDRGSPLDSRIISDEGYVARVRGLVKPVGTAPTPEQLIQTVAAMIQRPVDEVCSHRSGALGRALVAWYATRTGAARSMAEVGRWFCITGATLGVAIRLYRRQEKYRPLFERLAEVTRRLPDRRA